MSFEALHIRRQPDGTDRLNRSEKIFAGQYYETSYLDGFPIVAHVSPHETKAVIFVLAPEIIEATLFRDQDDVEGEVKDDCEAIVLNCGQELAISSVFDTIRKEVWFVHNPSESTAVDNVPANEIFV